MFNNLLRRRTVQDQRCLRKAETGATPVLRNVLFKAALALGLRQLREFFRSGVEFLQVTAIGLQQALESWNKIVIGGHGVESRIVRTVGKPRIVTGVTSPIRFDFFVVA